MIWASGSGKLFQFLFQFEDLIAALLPSGHIPILNTKEKRQAAENAQGDNNGGRFRIAHT
jgi:hypothetical protein